jgi:hypothetical protein
MNISLTQSFIQSMISTQCLLDSNCVQVINQPMLTSSRVTSSSLSAHSLTLSTLGAVYVCVCMLVYACTDVWLCGCRGGMHTHMECRRGVDLYTTITISLHDAIKGFTRIISVCAVLCCAVLCCAVLWCNVLYCTVRFCNPISTHCHSILTTMRL